jgi:toxin ParE1/3/4
MVRGAQARVGLPRFPYAVVFLVRVEELRVLAIAHAKRRPGYWLSRVR